VEDDPKTLNKLSGRKEGEPRVETATVNSSSWAMNLREGKKQGGKMNITPKTWKSRGYDQENPNRGGPFSDSVC